LRRRYYNSWYGNSNVLTALERINGTGTLQIREDLLDSDKRLFWLIERD
jgi:hypothetical protein